LVLKFFKDIKPTKNCVNDKKGAKTKKYVISKSTNNYPTLCAW